MSGIEYYVHVEAMVKCSVVGAIGYIGAELTALKFQVATLPTQDKRSSYWQSNGKQPYTLIVATTVLNNAALTGAATLINRNQPPSPPARGTREAGQSVPHSRTDSVCHTDMWALGRRNSRRQRWCWGLELLHDL